MKKKLFNWYRNWLCFNAKPQVGDLVETYITRDYIKVVGQVTHVYKTYQGQPGYCWIDKQGGGSCTASFSYCNFTFLNQLP